MKKSTLYLPLLLGIFTAAGIWLGSMLSNNSMDNSLLADSSVKKRKLNRLIDLIDERYVDQVNTDSIVDATVTGILSNLDPHTTYIPSEQAEQLENNMRGEFVGIGIRFFVNNDSLSVLHAIEGGPSRKAGIRGGDKILYVNGKPIYGDNNDATNLLKGKDGSKVVLGILRPGDTQITNIKVVRGNVAINSIEATYMLDKDLGYIKINRFSSSTESEFTDAIKELKDKGAQDIVLDLRDNPGGILSGAIAIADEFLEEDKLILFQRDRNDERKDSYATDDGAFEDSKAYILINENSASASEVIAGALQDNDTGTIVGRRSFGKGLVQQEIKLGDGSAVRLTVARYYTPTGRSIQRPYSKGTDAYFKEYINRYENGELLDADNIQVNDSLKKTTPSGKVVYGGGGIIPDVFVPSPAGYIMQTLDYFARTGFADQFINQFLQNEGAQLREMDSAVFLNEYEVKERMMQDFIDYAQLHNTSIQLPGYRDEIALILKSTLAEQLFNTEMKIQLLNKEDAMIKKVLSLYKQER